MFYKWQTKNVQTKCLTDGEKKIADQNTKYLTAIKLQKHKYTFCLQKKQKHKKILDLKTTCKNMKCFTDCKQKCASKKIQSLTDTKNISTTRNINDRQNTNHKQKQTAW